MKQFSSAVAEGLAIVDEACLAYDRALQQPWESDSYGLPAKPVLNEFSGSLLDMAQVSAAVNEFGNLFHNPDRELAWVDITKARLRRYISSYHGQVDRLDQTYIFSPANADIQREIYREQAARQVAMQILGAETEFTYFTPSTRLRIY